MRLQFRFALRYLFSRKSTHAINIISGISVFGITLGSAALVVILSVFNGFEDVLRRLIGSFKPDLQITAAQGKVFRLDSVRLEQIRSLPGVLALSQTLEEIALFEHEGLQQLGMLKGVDDAFPEVIALDTALSEGEFRLRNTEQNYYCGVAGMGLEYALGISVKAAYIKPVHTYMPRRDKKNLSTSSQPFRQREIYPSGTFSVLQSDFDKYLITHIDLVRDLLAYTEGEASALELKIDAKTSESALKAQLQDILGSEFVIKNRYEQDEAFFKITNAEKWVGFLIFTFTLILVAFNMVGALWMLVLDKKHDIATLQAMGASRGVIRGIFLTEGALMSLLGGLAGCLIAVILCLLQEYVGLVKLGGSGDFIIDRYPVSMRPGDFALVLLTVVCIGTLAAWLPAWRAGKIAGVPNKE